MKVIGANFAKKVEINNTGKNIVLGYTDKSGKFRVIRVDKDLEVWERITEENKFKFGPSMGWGFLGAVILGPIESIQAEAAKLVEMAEAEEAAEKEAVANAATAAETLLKLKQLYDAGVLTEEEYAGKREKLIEKL